MCVWFIGEPVTVSIFSLFPFLPCPASQPLGMIINLIIKHLLPTAPALSLPCGPPGTPSQERGGRERRRRAGEKGRACRRSQREGLERAERQIQKGSSSHCRILLHRREAVFLCGSRQRVKLCDPRTKERRKEQSDTGEELEGITARGSPHLL